MEIQGVAQARRDKFERTLPCYQCMYGDICKYKGTIEPIEIPEMLEVTYVCKKKAELDNAIKNSTI